MREEKLKLEIYGHQELKNAIKYNISQFLNVKKSTKLVSASTQNHQMYCNKKTNTKIKKKTIFIEL